MFRALVGSIVLASLCAVPGFAAEWLGVEDTALTVNGQLSNDLAIEKDKHDYLVEGGFRREKHPPRWELIAYVMLNLDAGRHATDLTYRLRRISMCQVKADAVDALEGGRAERTVLCSQSWRQRRG